MAIGRASDAVWAAVDHLTQPTKQRVERDDGTVTWADVPSLLDQASSALVNGNEGAGGVRWGTQAERSPLDLDLMEVCAIIRGTTEALLRERKQKVDGRSVGAHVRELAAIVVTNEPGELWWWEYRFASWARLLETYLRVVKRQPMALRLRNSACPQCEATQVVEAGEYGNEVKPALVIAFRDGYARAAECSACGHHWWRGDDLIVLAKLLGVLPS